MKKLLFLALAVTGISSAKAQSNNDNSIKSFFFSIGPELGIPSNSPFTVSYGASAKGEVRVSQQLGVTLTAAYEAYHYRQSFVSFTGQTSNLNPSFIPVKGGLKYFVGPGFYGEGEVGSAIDNGSGSGNQFIYSLGIGFDIGINKISDIDLGFRYEGYTERQYQVTGIRVAYRLGW